jgi:hypothetical protein
VNLQERMDMDPAAVRWETDETVVVEASTDEASTAVEYVNGVMWFDEHGVYISPSS